MPCVNVDVHPAAREPYLFVPGPRAAQARSGERGAQQARAKRACPARRSRSAAATQETKAITSKEVNRIKMRRWCLNAFGCPLGHERCIGFNALLFAKHTFGIAAPADPGWASAASSGAMPAESQDPTL